MKLIILSMRNGDEYRAHYLDGLADPKAIKKHMDTNPVCCLLEYSGNDAAIVFADAISSIDLLDKE